MCHSVLMPIPRMVQVQSNVVVTQPQPLLWNRTVGLFGDFLRLIVQPGDGTAPLIQAIKSAKKSVEIIIFRLDQADVEHALEDAAERGVSVHALIAFTNRGGERSLRKLE